MKITLRTAILITFISLSSAVMPAVAVRAQASSTSTTTTNQSQSQTATQPSAGPSPNNNIANNVCRGVLSATNDNIPNNTTITSCQENSDDNFSFLIKKIINIFSVVVGAVSVVMIIIGGFRYIISGGDSSGISGAKNTILYAIVGLVIVLFAQVIIRFVLTILTPGK